MEAISLGPDTIYHNAGGVIAMTGHAALDRDATAIAVKDGRILAIGSETTMAQFNGANRVDLQGAIVMPGLIDCHNHFVGTSLGWNNVQLADAKTIEELLSLIGERTTYVNPGEWVVCSSRWHETNLHERRLPTATELDRVAPNNPVYLPRGGHVVVTNSYGLKMAGIHEESEDPEGGEFVRDASGHLTGMLLERPAFSRLTRLLPAVSEDLRRGSIRAGIKAYNRVGITAVREPGVAGAEMRSYQAVVPVEKSIRASIMWRVDLSKTKEERAAWIDSIAPTSGFGDGWMSVWGLKVGIDGGVEGGYFRDPYANNPNFRGLPLTTAENLDAIVTQADSLGWRVGVHVVGDAALEMLLSTFERARTQRPGHTIEHAFSPIADAMQRTYNLGMGVTLQHSLVYALGGNMVSYWGKERAEACTPSREWLDSHTLVGLGTDSPVTNYDPWLNVFGFATRSTESAGVLGPEHRISIAEALEGYTMGSARIMGLEDQIGSLAPGKAADFIALDRDPLSTRPEDIAKTQVRRTVVGGRSVYEGS